MHSPHRALSGVTTTLPADSESIIVLDSTRGLITAANASITTGNAFLAPGRLRNHWAGAIVRYTVACTAQNVTALDQILTGNAGTATDWETQGAAGSHTVTAGTTAVIEFKPLAADWRIRIDAGANNPDALVVRWNVIWAEDYGS